MPEDKVIFDMQPVGGNLLQTSRWILFKLPLWLKESRSRLRPHYNNIAIPMVRTHDQVFMLRLV